MTSGEPIADAIAELMVRAPEGFALGLHMLRMQSRMSFRSYPEAWVDHYSVEGLAIADPVLRWASYDTGSVRWSDLAEGDEFGVFEQARTHGLTYGMAISIGPEGNRTVGGFARADREFTFPEMAEIEAFLASLHERTEGLDVVGGGALRMIENMGVTLQIPPRFG